MPKIIFNDAVHSYSDLNGTPYKSVSSIFKNFKVGFDSEFIATRKILVGRYKSEYNSLRKLHEWDSPIIVEELKKLIDPEILEKEVSELIQSWEGKGQAARERGTKIHLTVEHASIDRGYAYSIFDGGITDVISPAKTYDNETIKDNLYELEDGFYPELLIYNEKHKIAGQSDGVYIKTIGDKRIVNISDYKTDAAIAHIPDFWHPKKGYEKLLGPVNHLSACNINEYSLKMSMYGWMLEQFGFKVNRLAIQKVEYIDSESIIGMKFIEIPYRNTEVKEMLLSL